MRAIAVHPIDAAASGPSAGGVGRSLSAGALAWVALSAALAAAAVRAGTPAQAALAVMALAVTPGLVTLAVAPQRSRPWALALVIFVWTAFAYLATTLSGGAGSPAAACFAIAPAFAVAVGARREALEALVFAAVGYALAAAGAAPLGGLFTGAAPLALGLGGFVLSVVWIIAERFAAPLASAPASPAHTAPAPASLSIDAEGRVRAGDVLALQRLDDEGDVIGQTIHSLAARVAGAEAGEAMQLALARALAGETGRAIVRTGAAAFAVEIHPAPDGATALIVDIADLAGRLETLERDAAKAKEARAVRSRQTAELSHELRTPLSHILGFTEIMQRELYGPLAPKYQEYVGLIQTSGRNLLDLIGGLMDLSRLDGGRYALDPERFDARDIVGEVVRLSSDAAARKGVALSANMPDAPIEIDADPRALRQMIVNLTSNAVKFTPQGGSVVVGARVAEGALLIEVADTGPGIAPEDRVRLGQAFERGTGVQGVEGVGLGLALTRAFAELHGGALSFDDAPGGGALVRIRLPVLARPRPGM